MAVEAPNWSDNEGATGSGDRGYPVEASASPTSGDPRGVSALRLGRYPERRRPLIVPSISSGRGSGRSRTRVVNSTPSRMT